MSAHNFMAMPTGAAEIQSGPKWWITPLTNPPPDRQYAIHRATLLAREKT